MTLHINYRRFIFLSIKTPPGKVQIRIKCQSHAGRGRWQGGRLANTVLGNLGIPGG